jgi:hypothetical protein
LAKWVRNIVAEGTIWKSSEAAIQLPLLQQESQTLLNYLIKEGYCCSLFPKIGVAQQRLRQLCPYVDAPSSGTSNMIDWRRLRDIDLQYGEKEIQHIERLVAFAHACFFCLDSLVPRLGDKKVQPKEADAAGDDEEEDEDNIDWEEGGEFGDGHSNALDGESHFATVELALAVMESTGAVRGGEIDIDFAKINYRQNDCNPDTGQQVD